MNRHTAGEHLPARIDYKTAGPEFWKRYHIYRRLRQKESRPDDPIRPNDVEEKRLRHDSPFDFEYHYEIAKDGLLLSWFSGTTQQDIGYILNLCGGKGLKTASFGIGAVTGA